MPTAETTVTVAETASGVITGTAATDAGASVSETGVPHPNWVEVWDKKYGYGIALPCWWTVYPTPPQGMHGTMTVQSYDEAYAQKHTVRGEWPNGEPPSGVVKIDFIGWEGIDPQMSTADAVRQQLTNDEQTVKTVEERTAGPNKVVVADVRSKRDPNQPHYLYIYRLAPDKLLVASAFPSRAVESAVVQGILASVALTPQEKINTPTFAPGEALPEVNAGCRATGE
jgi:hypothetical protein